MKKSSKIVTGLLLLVGLWFWSILVWTEPTPLNSDSRPQNWPILKSSFVGKKQMAPLKTAPMTSVGIHLNEVKAAQKAIQAAITRNRELKNSWRKGRQI